LAALRSGGPYPLLAISGEQGSAKTVLSKLLNALIDPNTAPVQALSREQRELMIGANNSYLLAFDNLSGLSHWLSDALCRLATGGSFAVRQLYTDDEEVLFEASRPILLNGIEDVISRPDLDDRTIFLTLAPIPEANRRPEVEISDMMVVDVERNILIRIEQAQLDDKLGIISYEGWPVPVHSEPKCGSNAPGAHSL
jgi:hypothetical protein